MFRFQQYTSIGLLRVETDWPALVYYLRARQHPCPPREFRVVRLEVSHGGTMELTAAAEPSACPRRVDVMDACFEVTRESIRGTVPDTSVHQSLILDWLWYALAILCCPDGWEAVHAAAVERDGKAVLFQGNSLVGKTTRAVRAMESGARFLSDDIALVSGAGRVRGWDAYWHVHPAQARSLGVECPTLDFAGKARVRPAAVAAGQEYAIEEALGAPGVHIGPGFDSSWRPRRDGPHGLRVLFLGRDPAGWFGGDLAQAFEWVRGLRATGVRAAYYPYEHGDLGSWDVVHLMHAQFPWVREAARRVREAGLPLVVSAITHGRPPRQEMEPVISLADRVACYAESEATFLRGLFPEDAPGKYVVAPVGVPAALYECPPVKAEPMVFSATAYVERKRVLSLLRVCVSANVPVTFAGPMDQEECGDYFAEMRATAGDWRGARFFGLLDNGALWYWFHRAWVYVDNAEMEPFGLSSLQALAAGCNLIHTQASWAAEFFGRYGVLCDPDDTAGLLRLIKQQIGLPRGGHGYRPPTCEEAARALVPIYREVCGA